ncbi:MAG: PAS domain S-box protein [Blastomonas sp.]
MTTGSDDDAISWKAGAEPASDLSPMQIAIAANAVGYFDWDMASGEVQWNSALAPKLGLPSAAMDDMASWSEFVIEEDRAIFAASVAEAERTKARVLKHNYRVAVPGSGMRVLEGKGRCYYDGNGKLVRMIGLTFDVTARENEREALARTAEQMRTIIDTVPDALVMINVSGIVLSFNNAAERMFGFDAEEIIGRNVSAIMPDDIASRHDRFIDDFLETGEKKVIGKTRELIARRKDGTTFPIELNVGEAVMGEERWFTGFVRDISERVEATARHDALMARYLRSARFNVLGEVAAGLAHELNQPLAAGSNFIAAARMRLQSGSGGDAAQELMAQASKQITRAGEIIRRLRDFLSGTVRESQNVGLSEMIDDAVQIALPASVRNLVTIQRDLDPCAETVSGDRIQVQQILVNLLRNSVEAMQGANVAKPAIRLAAHPQGDMIEIAVEDNGPGFSAHVLENLHIPFTSTKPDSNMGIGLSLCRRMAEAQGGQLVPGNRAKGGARVSFTLPMGRNRVVEEEKGHAR